MKNAKNMKKRGVVVVAKKRTMDYEKSLSFIVKKFEENRHKSLTAVNKLLIELYQFIGETIVNLQEKSKWGGAVVEKLSRDLRMKYPEQSGFSVQNLWYMKKFYSIYRDKPILQTLSGEISWTNNVIILDKTKTMEEKEFYLKMSIKERWSFRELRRQIDSAYFERFILSQKPDKLMKIEQDKLAIPLEDIHRHLKEDLRRDCSHFVNAVISTPSTSLRAGSRRNLMQGESVEEGKLNV